MNQNNSYAGKSGGGRGLNSQYGDRYVIKPAVEIKSLALSEGLFDAQALKIAETFVGVDNFGNTIGVSSTQLRRIFDEVKRFERVLSLSGSKWEEQLPYIKMIKSKVAYAVARASKQKSAEKGVYKNLESFINSGISLIKTQKDYSVFVALFEAVYGFYYEMSPKKD